MDESLQENRARWIEELQSLNGVPCLYKHHLADSIVKAGPLCDSAIQDITHGCAHALNNRLLRVVNEMFKAGLLSEEVAKQYGVGIRQQKGVLFQDDATYQSYELSASDLSQIQTRQINIIKQRQQIASELLSILQKNDSIH